MIANLAFPLSTCYKQGMKEKNQLQIGDTVLWRGDPPRAPRQTALVTGIDRDAAADFNHTGVEVDRLKWKHVIRAIVTFDSGSWDYGYNIRRLKQPKAWQSDSYSRLAPETPPTATPRPVEQAEQADHSSIADDQHHIDFLQGMLQYEWETTPDDSEDRKALLQQIEQAQAWLHGMERVHERATAGGAEIADVKLNPLL